MSSLCLSFFVHFQLGFLSLFVVSPLPLSLSCSTHHSSPSRAMRHSVDDAPSQRFLRPADFSYHRHRPSFPNDNDDDDDALSVLSTTTTAMTSNVSATRKIRAQCFQDRTDCIVVFSPFSTMPSIRTYDETDRVNETGPSFSFSCFSSPSL